jgi:Na+/H+ antiporter NhaD/arsenite permease-like protein
MDELQTVLAVTIFAFTYLVIAVQKIPTLRLDRPGGALSGAVLMVVCGVLSFDEAWAAVDGRTLVLLLGMMILVIYLDLAGFFEFASRFVLRRTRGPVQLLVGLTLLSGLLSALFLNDAVCLMLTPPLLSILRRTTLPRTPYLVALAMSANVGSVMTVTGNPQNMLIGVYSGWSYAEFLVRMVPVGLACLGATLGILFLTYGRQLEASATGTASLLPVHGVDILTDDIGRSGLHRRLMTKALVVLGGVLAGFVAIGDLPLVAIGGAVALMLWARRSPRQILGRVDWVLMLFFAGLFVVVRGLEKTGLVHQLAEAAQAMHGSSLATQIPVFSAVTVVASNVVSNVPFVVLAREFVPKLIDPPLMWLVLAMASTLAGNLTIPGSVATLIVLERAKGEAQVGFGEFLRVGSLVTVVTVALGALILGLEHRLWPRAF